MVWGAIAVAVGSTLLGAWNEKKQGKEASRSAEANARIARAQAADALERGREDEAGVRRMARRLVGTQRAGLAGQGIELDDGSALDVQLDTARQSELDALTVRNNAMRESWGYKVGATEYTRQAAAARREAAGRVAGTLLTGAARVAGYLPVGGGGRSDPLVRRGYKPDPMTARQHGDAIYAAGAMTAYSGGY